MSIVSVISLACLQSVHYKMKVRFQKQEPLFFDQFRLMSLIPLLSCRLAEFYFVDYRRKFKPSGEFKVVYLHRL